MLKCYPVSRKLSVRRLFCIKPGGLMLCEPITCYDIIIISSVRRKLR